MRQRWKMKVVYGEEKHEKEKKIIKWKKLKEGDRKENNNKIKVYSNNGKETKILWNKSILQRWERKKGK